MSENHTPSSAALAARVLTLEMTSTADGDPFRRWAVDECERLLVKVKDIVQTAQERPDITVVVSFSATDDPWEAAAMHAALEAIRGALHSLTPELGDRARLNVVVIEAGDTERAQAALEYIASPGGAYVAGSTFDLREHA